MFISGIGFSKYILLLPVILIVQTIITLGIVFVLSAITVYIRDLEYFISVLLQLWMYVTPVLYSIQLIPEKFSRILYLNPMTQIINAYRNVFYYQQMPDMKALGIWTIIGIIGVGIGYFIFKKCEKRFAEEL